MHPKPIVSHLSRYMFFNTLSGSFARVPFTCAYGKSKHCLSQSRLSSPPQCYDSRACSHASINCYRFFVHPRCERFFDNLEVGVCNLFHKELQLCHLLCDHLVKLLSLDPRYCRGRLRLASLIVLVFLHLLLVGRLSVGRGELAWSRSTAR